jgi:hypothetical protein
MTMSKRPELHSVSSIYNEDGEPIMSGEAFRYEQYLDQQAMDEWQPDDDYDYSDYRDVLIEAYAAMDGDSNDAEHDALCSAVDLIENLLRDAGGELPPRPDPDDDHE